MKNPRLFTEKEKFEIEQYRESKTKNIENFRLERHTLAECKKLSQEHNKLGYALQYLFLNNISMSLPSSYENIDEKVIKLVAEQLSLVKSDIKKYYIGSATKKRHFEVICKNLDVRKFELTSELIIELENIIRNNNNN